MRGEGKVVGPPPPQPAAEVGLGLLVLGLCVLRQDGDGAGQLVLLGPLPLGQLALVDGQPVCSLPLPPLPILNGEVRVVQRGRGIFKMLCSRQVASQSCNTFDDDPRKILDEKIIPKIPQEERRPSITYLQ